MGINSLTNKTLARLGYTRLEPDLKLPIREMGEKFMSLLAIELVKDLRKRGLIYPKQPLIKLLILNKELYRLL